ncbi:J domain-containing protein [Escherichia coli]|nr:J domain-containing protein [Escherichia coli]
MKNCWKILDIEETTDVDIIRRAYLALLPSFHPETDPQGFKQLRQAYEEALRIAQSPAKSVWQPEEYEVAEHEILLAFRALLASDSERFLPSAWQRFIQQLNYCSMEEIDELRWSLCTIAMNTAHLILRVRGVISRKIAVVTGGKYRGNRRRRTGILFICHCEGECF